MSDVKKKIEEIIGPVLDKNKDLEGRLNAALAKISYLDEALSKQGQLKAENYNKYLQVKNNLEYYKSEIAEHLEKIAEQAVLIGKQRDEISVFKMQSAKIKKAVETKEKLIRDYADMQLALEDRVRYLQSEVRKKAAKDESIKDESETIKHAVLVALESCLKFSDGKPVDMFELRIEMDCFFPWPEKEVERACKELAAEGLICIHTYSDDEKYTLRRATVKNNLEKDIDLLVDVISQGNGPSVSWAWITEQQPTISKWDWEYAEKVIKAAEERNLVRVVPVGMYGYCYLALVDLSMNDELAVDEGVGFIVDLIKHGTKKDLKLRSIGLDELLNHKEIEKWSDDFYNEVIEVAKATRQAREELIELPGGEFKWYIILNADK